jgi:hypothetical protein
MDDRRTSAQVDRNTSIWRANREEGVGTGKLARLYGISRQRVKQIIDREDSRKDRDRPAPGRTSEKKIGGEVR